MRTDWHGSCELCIRVLQGFGGITSGVIREAAHTAQRPALKPDLALLAAVSRMELIQSCVQDELGIASG